MAETIYRLEAIAAGGAGYKKIQFIKDVRAFLGTGLKETKEMVDAIEFTREDFIQTLAHPIVLAETSKWDYVQTLGRLLANEHRGVTFRRVTITEEHHILKATN